MGSGAGIPEPGAAPNSAPFGEAATTAFHSPCHLAPYFAPSHIISLAQRNLPLIILTNTLLHAHASDCRQRHHPTAFGFGNADFGTFAAASLVADNYASFNGMDYRQFILAGTFTLNVNLEPQ